VEELITGSETWPECADEDPAVAEEARAPEWWEPQEFVSEEGPGFKDFFQWAKPQVTDRVRGVLSGYKDRQGRVTQDRVNLEALGSERRGVRHVRSCAVCARQDWHTEFTEVLFWQQPADSGREGLFNAKAYG
jgi:hypothetical protein